MAGWRVGCRGAGGLAIWVGLGLLSMAWAAGPPPEAAERAAVAAVIPDTMRPQTAAEIIPPRPRAEENAAPLLMEAVATLEAESVWDTTLANLAAETYSAAYSAPDRTNLVGLVEALHLPGEGNRSPTVAELCDEFARQLQGSAARQALALCRVKNELGAVANPANYADTIVVKAMLPALVRACDEMVECQAGLRVTRTGLRLKRHRENHGSYPASLDGLQQAEILPETQCDPFTGKALCYRQEGGGFVLYSVGLDGTDDGGKPRGGEAGQGFDIVWRAAR